jgi:hypothetical protein
MVWLSNPVTGSLDQVVLTFKMSINARVMPPDTVCVQAEHFLSIHAQLSAVSSASIDAAATPDHVKISLGNLIRKLKQHWQLGEYLTWLQTVP